MAINWKNYPKNWREIRLQILARDGDCCKECGLKNYTVGWRNGGEKFVIMAAPGSYVKARELAIEEKRKCGVLPTVIVLHISHQDHDTKNNEDSNLAALCQYHHLKHDSYHHSKNFRETAKRRRGIREAKVYGGDTTTDDSFF